jgi:hypothetical protein
MQKSDFTPELASLFEKYSALTSNPSPSVEDIIETYLEIAGEKGGRPVLDRKHTEQLVEVLRNHDLPAGSEDALELLCLKTLALVENPGREVPWPVNIAPLAAFLAERRTGSEQDGIDLSSSEF